MRQFFIFLFTGASIAILDLIDSAFGNHISLDSICVMSAFTVIYWCVDCICKAGEYAYRVKLKYESECFVFQVAIISITTSIGIYGFALGSGIDFFIRGLYYKYKSINLVNKEVVA